jgi:hypothetical protein
MTDEPDPDPLAEGDDMTAADEACAETEEDAVDAAADDQANRLWLRTCMELVKERKIETDPSSRVQFALDCMAIAAAERAVRILGADLPG